jgi:hypothetical protein
MDDRSCFGHANAFFDLEVTSGAGNPYIRAQMALKFVSEMSGVQQPTGARSMTA